MLTLFPVEMLYLSLLRDDKAVSATERDADVKRAFLAELGTVFPDNTASASLRAMERIANHLSDRRLRIPLLRMPFNTNYQRGS